MIGCLRTRFRKQPIIALLFESENELKFYNLEARAPRKIYTSLGVMRALTLKNCPQDMRQCAHLQRLPRI